MAKVISQPTEETLKNIKRAEQVQKMIQLKRQAITRVSHKEWRQRVNFFKKALESCSHPREYYCDVYKNDTPQLFEKVWEVAEREMSANSGKIRLAEMPAEKPRSGRGKNARKVAKARRRQMDAKRAGRIFGLR